MAIIILKR